MRARRGRAANGDSLLMIRRLQRGAKLPFLCLEKAGGFASLCLYETEPVATLAGKLLGGVGDRASRRDFDRRGALAFSHRRQHHRHAADLRATNSDASRSRGGADVLVL